LEWVLLLLKAWLDTCMGLGGMIRVHTEKEEDKQELVTTARTGQQPASTTKHTYSSSQEKAAKIYTV